MLAFSLMASKDHFDHYSQFEFLVFTGVLCWPPRTAPTIRAPRAGVVTWLYVIFIQLCHLFDVHSSFAWCVWACTQIAAHLAAPRRLYLTEVGLDVLFALFAFGESILAGAPAALTGRNPAAGIASGAKCNEKATEVRATAALAAHTARAQTSKVCDDSNSPVAASVFSLLLCFCFLVSAVLSFKAFRDPPGSNAI
jgi:hypothetical protein